jgi:threonine synthase
MRTLPRHAAVFAEPAGATGFAGLMRANAQGVISPDERVVVVVTGNGLKDVDNAVRAGGQPISIDPTVQALKQAFG